ncbi:MAG: metallophosphoesterase [Nitrospira defluvii]|nr:metallophosphoesterase [Nitrospira defluvii]
MGLPASEGDFFYNNFIPLIRSGDTLVLLGDILDYWISAKEIQQSTVLNNWRDLYDCLSRLRKSQVAVEYIPGNHDAFVFYTECGDVDDFFWSTWLFENCGTFRSLRDETRERRLSRVCDIHYPFFRKVIGRRNVLFTHGHWIDLAWRILAGDAGRLVEGRRLAKFWVVAKALNTCLVYKYASDIRRVFNQYLDDEDIFELTRRAEDVSYCILAEMLISCGSSVPGELAFTQASQEMDKAFQEFVRGHETRDRRACRERGRQLLEEWMRDDPPATQVDRVRDALQRQSDAYSYSLYRDGQGRGTKVKYTPLSELADFDALVFGHFHKPRAGASVCDDGCMLTNPSNKKVQTFLVIEPDGHFVPSWSV